MESSANRLNQVAQDCGIPASGAPGRGDSGLQSAQVDSTRGARAPSVSEGREDRHASSRHGRELPVDVGAARWLRQGYRMVYAPEIVIEHSHQLTFVSFWRQHYHYGEGAFQFHQVRAQAGLGKIRVEPLSFYLRLIQYPFSQAGKAKALGFALLLVISQAANFFGFFAKKRSWKSSEPDCETLESRAVAS